MLQQVDLSLAKRLLLGEKTWLEVRAEGFNVVNRAQYGDPTGDFSVVSQFGVIQSTINTTPVGTGTPRQIQLAVRLFF
jgi:hypothetical protein